MAPPSHGGRDGRRGRRATRGGTDIEPTAQHRRLLERLGRPGAYLARRLEEAREILNGRGRVSEPIPADTRLIIGIMFTIRAVQGTEVSVRASSITYTFLFSLVPLLATTLFMLAGIPGLQDERKSLESALFNYFVPGAARAVQQYISQFTEEAAAAGAVSSLVFFVVTLLLLRSVEASFNVIWKVRHLRTWRQRLEVVAMAFVVGTIALTALGAITGLAARLSAQVGVVGTARFSTVLSQMGLGVAELVVAWLIFAAATKTLPNTLVRWRSALLGGVVFGTAWNFLKGSFTWYITTFPSYENLYGALGTIPVFLLWIYLSFLLLFVCGCMAYVHQNMHSLVEQERMREGVSYPMGYFAVAVMALLVERFHDRSTDAKLTVEELASRLGVVPMLVDRVLEPMVAHRLVVQVEEDGGVSYLLGTAPESVSAREVVLAATGESLAVPEHRNELQPALRAQISDIFGAARVGRDAALDAVDMLTLGRGVQSEVEIEEALAGGDVAPAAAGDARGPMSAGEGGRSLRRGADARARG